MPKKLFIDGRTGTAAQKITSVLAPFVRAGAVEVIEVESHRDLGQRMAAMAASDLAVLCTHDDVSRKTMAALKEKGITTRVLDTSSAFRSAPEWVYGFPELSAAQPKAITEARYVANPGCYATGAVAILRPLVDAGLIAPSSTLEITGFSGYSGGGKDMVAAYETGSTDEKLARAILMYSLSAPHKHLPEITCYSGLTYMPNFTPHVVPVPCGMIVRISFNEAVLSADLQDVQEVYRAAYADTNGVIQVVPFDPPSAQMDFSNFVTINRDFAREMPDDRLGIHVTGWASGVRRQVTVLAALDNLGKGAATQAAQNVGLMLGF
jgi:N-acetyl-gamma-glutamyl-phosphate reductase